MEEEAVVIPSKVRIRNKTDYGYGSSGIKVISLSIGTGDGAWHKLVDDVTDIHNGNMDEQEFVFRELLVSPQWIWKNKAKCIRTEVRQNHGSSTYNFFFGFRLFGVAL